MGSQAAPGPDCQTTPFPGPLAWLSARGTAHVPGATAPTCAAHLLSHVLGSNWCLSARKPDGQVCRLVEGARGLYLGHTFTPDPFHGEDGPWGPVAAWTTGVLQGGCG